MTTHEKAVEAATRAYLYELDLDPDMPHGLEPDAEIWWKVQAPMISAAITAYLASMQEQGWAMVPREPTEAMLNAAMDDLDWWLKPNEGEAAKLNGEQKNTLSSVYAAMLAAKEE